MGLTFKSVNSIQARQTALHNVGGSQPGSGRLSEPRPSQLSQRSLASRDLHWTQACYHLSHRVLCVPCTSQGLVVVSVIVFLFIPCFLSTPLSPKDPSSQELLHLPHCCSGQVTHLPSYMSEQPRSLQLGSAWGPTLSCFPVSPDSPPP